MRNKKIDDAAPLLSKGTMSPIDFINKIRHNDDSLCKSLSEFNDGAATADDESELDKEIETALENELPAAIDPNDVNGACGFDDMDEPPPKEGSCIACNTEMACVVFTPCRHNAVCNNCFKGVEKAHVKKINTKYSDNPRKIERELPRIQCPICNEPASDIIKIHANSYA